MRAGKLFLKCIIGVDLVLFLFNRKILKKLEKEYQ